MWRCMVCISRVFIVSLALLIVYGSFGRRYRQVGVVGGRVCRQVGVEGRGVLGLVLGVSFLFVLCLLVIFFFLIDFTAVKLENFFIYVIIGVFKQWLRELFEFFMIFVQYGDFFRVVGECFSSGQGRQVVEVRGGSCQCLS